MDSTIAVSCISAVVARTVTHPLDTIKTRKQVGQNVGIESLFQNPRLFFKSLYRGYGVAIIFSTPATSLYLGSYDIIKHSLEKNYGLASDNFLSHGISGISAELLAGCIYTPMEVIKTRMQVSKASDSQPSGRQLLKKILQTEGPRGLLRGYPLGLAVFGPYSITYFVFYEKLKASLAKRDESPTALRYWLASSISVAIAATISNPMDVIKVRWQSSDHSSRDKSVSILVRRLIREEGSVFKPFLRGTLSRVVWLVPSTSITFTMFEVLKDMFVTDAKV